MISNPIKIITLEECLPLRHQVLWPNLTQQDCIDSEDQQSTHYGYIINDQLVSCLSLLPINPTHYQIRKFATLPPFQGKGIGTSLFKFILQMLKDNKVQTLSLNARSTAKRFYDKFNFEITGEIFSKHQVDFIPMGIRIDQLQF